jgi:hypothetical protein
VPAQSYALTLQADNSLQLAATVDGQAVTSGSSVEEGKTVNFTITDPSGELNVHATINGQAISLTGGSPYVGSFTMPSQASTLRAYATGD